VLEDRCQPRAVDGGHIQRRERVREADDQQHERRDDRPCDGRDLVVPPLVDEPPGADQTCKADQGGEPQQRARHATP
jgi:hypothetical protein